MHRIARTALFLVLVGAVSICGFSSLSFASESSASLSPETAARTSSVTAPTSLSFSQPTDIAHYADSRERSPSRMMDIGGVSVGAGLVALGIGVKFGLDARDIGDATGADKSRPGVIDPRDQARDRMALALGIGAAAVVTGGVLMYLGATDRSSSKKRDRLVVTPGIGADSFTVQAAGRF